MHVVYALRPGGMEFGVVKLVNGLDPQRVQSSICSTAAGATLKPLVRPDVPVHELARRPGNDPSLVWNLYNLFRRERPDIVHTHAWGTLVEGLLAARLARVPVAIHGEHGTLQLRAYQRVIQRVGWTAATRLLSVSSRLADRLAHETGFPRQHVAVIRNGVDLSRFTKIDRAEARTSLGLGGGTPVVATVGRLVPVKDHAMLLDAIALLRAEDVPVTLMIAGDGPLRATLTERAVQLGIDGDVRFLGHRPDVERVFAAADAFVLSSESEGLSNTILEAMASGLPVVATRVGGADEMVSEGETGLLVPAKDSREMANALRTILRDQSRRQAMGAAARARVEAEFSLAGMIERYDGLYHDLARPRGRA